MNLLIDIVPTHVEIDNKKYKINTDFRTSILFELLIQDNSLEQKEKLIKALELYYPVIPKNIEEAIEKILWFYKCGKDFQYGDSSKSKNSSRTKRELEYSFEYDDGYIYAAFLDQYNIDLQDINYLHWWKFRAMFNSLKEDNLIVKMMGYRSVNLSEITDKEQRKQIKKMKELYKLPKIVDKESEEYRLSIEEALLNGGDISNLVQR
ncbi:bacteriophage Gp15 family protein [Clostridium perfringens]